MTLIYSILNYLKMLLWFAFVLFLVKCSVYNICIKIGLSENDACLFLIATLIAADQYGKWKIKV